MRNGFRQSMAWLHSWAGLIVGWILFAVFVMGTASYYRADITRWMQPEPIGVASEAQALRNAYTRLSTVAPDAPRWFIEMPNREDPRVRIAWQPRDGRFKSERLDPASGSPAETRATRGGEFFYRFHFQLYYLNALTGRWIVGACAMTMLVAMLSGIITHRRIFTDFFTFRAHKDQRSWLDAHNVSAVLALPFHLMITYSGLVALMTLLMALPADAVYKGDRAAYFNEVVDFAPADKAAGRPAPLTALSPLLVDAQSVWGAGQRPGRIFIDNPGDANARVKLTHERDSRISRAPDNILYDGVSGKRLSVTPEAGPAGKTYGVMYGLHMAQFAHGPLRLLFFICGLGGSTMVATGLLLWARKHRQQDEARARKAGRPGHVTFGTRLVENLNVGAVTGLPIAAAAYLWANRLLPVELAGRANWEINVFFTIWAACAIHPWLRAPRRAWLEQLALAVLAFALVPGLDLLTLGRIPMPAFDAALVGLALLPALAWWHLRRRTPGAPRGRSAARPRPTSLETADKGGAR